MSIECTFYSKEGKPTIKFSVEPGTLDGFLDKQIIQGEPSFTWYQIECNPENNGGTIQLFDALGTEETFENGTYTIISDSAVYVLRESFPILQGEAGQRSFETKSDTVVFQHRTGQANDVPPAFQNAFK